MREQGLTAMGVVYELSMLNAVSKVATHFWTVHWGAFCGMAPSLISAALVAYVFLSFNRWRQRRGIALKVLIRAFFPRRMFKGWSLPADVGFFLLNTGILTIVFGWAILSTHVVGGAVNAQLVSLFGARATSTLTSVQISVIMTVALFLAYELGYYVDHYLSHNVPFLWEFHKVHHTAEVLNPLTNYRVHPIDTVKFYNILAIVLGLTSGTIMYLFGSTATPFTIDGGNVILVAFICLIGHLQHSHFWIAFTGTWGRLLLSPAHHQIHHSTNPAHFNRNLGSFLGIFDWLFGTLYVPSAKRERLSFGVEEPTVANPHTITETLIRPFGEAINRQSGSLPRIEAIQLFWRRGRKSFGS
jgi:sterol desaturase/sphingolipid hydroxylase (fatty acid hydroxylase superfamily)